MVHVGLILGLMSVLEATMTLPGIAGIVLTIGTAVDSNVLIYERMREEQRAGRSLISALQAGFDRAFATIIDSNSTMAIAALILFFLGSGPVKGFAVVFILGIGERYHQTRPTDLVGSLGVQTLQPLHRIRVGLCW